MNSYLKQQIKADLFRYKGKSSIKIFLVSFWQLPGFRYILFYRLSKHYRLINPIGFFSRIMYKRLEVKFGFQIPRSVEIGPGFLIRHFGNLIINSKARIGNNCSIYPGVTIGATFRGNMQGVPLIGDRVWIGTNAVIVGGITIGNDVLIAPSSYVNISVPSNSIVFGNPAVIKFKQDAVQSYITNIYELNK